MSQQRAYPGRGATPTRLPLLLAVFLVILVLAVVMLWQLWPQQETGMTPEAGLRPVTARGSLSEEEKATVD